MRPRVGEKRAGETGRGAQIHRKGAHRPVPRLRRKLSPAPGPQLPGLSGPGILQALAPAESRLAPGPPLG
ncbi:hypothetical protein AAU61_14160 [Desulfocarbo indianensis]|nr:hypothetical protein AAU61_14160 [Desulfocarbo indianensis]